MRCHTLLSQSLRSFALCLFAALLLGVPAANAGPLDEARAAGHLGEGPDGYLHLVSDSAPSEAQELMKSVNSKRKAKFQEIATKQGVSLEKVATQAGAKLVERTKPGEHYQDAKGKWHQK